MDGKTKNGKPERAGTLTGSERRSMAEVMGKAILVQADAGRLPLGGGTVQTVITSPPYWDLREYDGEQGCQWPTVVYRPMLGLGRYNVLPWYGPLGREPTPEMFVAHLVLLLREVYRVLRDDGTLWLNIGDVYAGNGSHPNGLKAKNLVGIPWRLALALQADDWWLRSDPQWIKPNALPDTADRPGTAHEYVFLLSKTRHYFWDADAVKRASKYPQDDRRARAKGSNKQVVGKRANSAISAMTPGYSRTYPRRNWRTSDFYYDSLEETINHLLQVREAGGLLLGPGDEPLAVEVPTKGWEGAHFAVFPQALVEPLIKASCPPGGIVLDPFAGTGTTVAAAVSLGRLGIGADLFAGYLDEFARERLGRAPQVAQVDGQAALGELPLFGGAR